MPGPGHRDAGVISQGVTCVVKTMKLFPGRTGYIEMIFGKLCQSYRVRGSGCLWKMISGCFIRSLE
jgi:hypothetical protein